MHDYSDIYEYAHTSYAYAGNEHCIIPFKRELSSILIYLLYEGLYI
jgi:hypothetical protein